MMQKENILIDCANLGRRLEVAGGATLSSLVTQLKGDLGFTPICALVNNKAVSLDYALYSPKLVRFLPATDPIGERVYVRSLCMMLFRAVSKCAPGASLRIEHSVSHGYYCRLLGPDGSALPVSDSLLAELLLKMRELVEANLPFEKMDRPTDEVIELFRREGLHDKVRLLSSMHRLYTTLYRLDGTYDAYYGPLAASTADVAVFNLIKYREGFLLMAFDPQNPAVPRKPIDQQKMFGVFERYLQFNRIIRVSDVADLNEAILSGSTPQLINVAEAMHGNYIARIADRITDLHAEGRARIVLIAGPSSSGKTTFCKRLAIQLMTNLLTPKMISLDDYFVDREHTPRQPDGDYDYESLYALDLPKLNEDLSDLLEGKEVNLPTYSFELGRRVEKKRPLRLAPDDVLIIEGIHGLNPELTSNLPAERLFKIYISALTTLRIDDHNWISTTDNRLLRRIVRDHRYRSTSALETIRRWPSVRRGEEKWIFPYQENADATFNSSLIFELSVMKSYAEPLLHRVPHDSEQYATAYHLLTLLSYFDAIPTDYIPSTSLLREFLGGSSFKY